MHVIPARRSQFVRHQAAAAAIVTTLLLAAAPVAAQHPSSRSPAIPQVARTAGRVTTLLAAVDAAGLTETLLGRGPFTLFAPTDEAFARLPNGTVQDLLKPENREKLVAILTYHVVAGRVTAAQARSVRSAETVAGQSVRISTSGDQLRINDAVVRIADVPASNGLIHVIDRVLLPNETRAATPGSALELVELAIQRGVPLFNDGQPDATVAIYEIASRALLALGKAVPDDARRAVRAALAATGGSTRDRAFALRGGLDTARRSLRASMEITDSR
ncbi:MAG: fasciclin domain-containing protein [Gemmatimonadaceae bacterium]|nr:fasciclin domain-containing protein [Gemmatimonadaceae bacterium]